jgi:hypothetical protein
MRRRISLWGVTLGLAALCLFRATPAHASVTQVDIPLAGMEISDPCTGETVLVTSGVVHTVFDITVSASGNFVLGTHQNYQNLAGVGETTGTTYTGSSTSEMQSFSGSVPANVTTAADFELNAKGSAPNFKMHLLEVFVIDGQGNVTANIANFSSTCE